ncbi:MAG: DsbA family protein [Thermoleophilaceae bacterium]|nr:DsbA family protein [Thermoleophilaceae bacterium]
MTSGNGSASNATVIDVLPINAGAEDAQPQNDQPIFFFDLGSPYAWLVAERIGHFMPTALWQPVCAADLVNGPLWDGDRARVERLASEFGVLAVRWPADISAEDSLTLDTHQAMLVATFTKSIGRATSFAQAAFRQIYNAGRSVTDTDTLLIAAAACELHPRAILQAIEMQSTKNALASAAALARMHNVVSLPVVKVDGKLIDAEQLLALAADA